MENPILLLTLKILLLSFMAIGGFITTVPELHRYVVDLHGWMTDERFVTLFAIAQAAPGPNFIVVTLVGMEIGGIRGAALATIAACLPTLLIAYSVSKFWARYNRTGWYRVIERGMAPVAVGLVLATGLLLTSSASLGSLPRMAVTLGTAAFLLTTRRSPLIPLIVAAAAGAGGLL